MKFRLNSPEAKAILALVREGDYAHPGEQEAIVCVAKKLQQLPIQHAIDIGCGRGGTADWFHRYSRAKVVGVDIDAVSIDYARRQYPQVEFFQSDVAKLDQSGLGPFDLAYLFTSFYAFPDPAIALQSIRRVCSPSAHLLIFDYTQAQDSILPTALDSEIGKPIVLETIGTLLQDAQWDLIEVEDLSESFVAWYRNLLHRCEEKRAEIVATAGSDWYEYAIAWYGSLHDALATGVLGGAIVHAVAISKENSTSG
jgi:ubiquinone/menaquinone biosynthesis C-methylase UbiE